MKNIYPVRYQTYYLILSILPKVALSKTAQEQATTAMEQIGNLKTDSRTRNSVYNTGDVPSHQEKNGCLIHGVGKVKYPSYKN